MIINIYKFVIDVKNVYQSADDYENPFHRQTQLITGDKKCHHT